MKICEFSCRNFKLIWKWQNLSHTTYVGRMCWKERKIYEKSKMMIFLVGLKMKTKKTWIFSDLEVECERNIEENLNLTIFFSFIAFQLTRTNALKENWKRYN